MSDAGVGSPGRAWGRPGSQVVLHWCFHFCGFLQPVEMWFCFRVGFLFCSIFFLICQAHLFPAAQTFVSADADFYLLTYCTVRSHLSLRKPQRSQVPICCHLTRMVGPGLDLRLFGQLWPCPRGALWELPGPGWGCCNNRYGAALPALCCWLWRTFWNRTQAGQETWPCVWMICLERGGGRMCCVLDSRGQLAAERISLSAPCKAGSSGHQITNSGVNCLHIRVLHFYLEDGKLWLKKMLAFSINMQ